MYDTAVEDILIERQRIEEEKMAILLSDYRLYLFYKRGWSLQKTLNMPKDFPSHFNKRNIDITSPQGHMFDVPIFVGIC